MIAHEAITVASLPTIPALNAANRDRTVRPQKVPTVVPSGAKYGAVRLAAWTYDLAPDCTQKRPPEGGAAIPKNAKSPEENGVFRTSLHNAAALCTAEREGLSVRSIHHVCEFASQTHSGTQGLGNQSLAATQGKPTRRRARVGPLKQCAPSVHHLCTRPLRRSEPSERRAYTSRNPWLTPGAVRNYITMGQPKPN
jgi:hypothetical protein